LKNLVIVGGGTAGWLTALYAKKIFPEDNISLIQSKEIGILGAGEGSTSIITEFLDYLDIPIEDLIKKTKSTIKSGIKFTNWSKENNYYYHGFAITNKPFGFNYLNGVTNFFEYPDLSLLNTISFNNNESIESYDFVAKSSEENKVLMHFNDKVQDHKNTMDNFTKYAKHSLHFDARLLADFLCNLGIERGINCIEGKIIKINSNSNQDVYSLDLDNNKKIPTDFVFDCSGFSKLFIGNHFNSEWISFKDKLPMKKAIPFFIDIDKNNIPTYTESIAMDYGWIWKIPLQHRYGCGYVFDSDYISNEDAIKEIEKFLGFEPKYAKPNKGSFDFDPGCFKTVLKNNVIAVGLSSGFIEPLEATSILQTIVLLQRLFTNPSLMFNRNEVATSIFNDKYVSDCKEVLDLIQLHYLTNKKNTLFWSEFKNKNNVSESLFNKLQTINNSILFQEDIGTMFPVESYYLITKGMNILDINNIKNIYDSLNLKTFQTFKENQKEKQNNILGLFLKHDDFLRYLGGLSE
jgi:tryptophan halogenase